MHLKDDWKSDIFWHAAAALRGISRMVFVYCLFCILQGSSGFVLNAPNITSLSHTPADPQHFLTHYQSKWVMSVSVCVLLVLDWQNWLLIYLNWLSAPCRHGQLLHDMVKYSFKPEGRSDWLLGEWVCCDWLLWGWVCSGWFKQGFHP